MNKSSLRSILAQAEASLVAFILRAIRKPFAPAHGDVPQDWRRIGEDITTHLEKDPGYFYKVETVRGKYVPLNNPHQAPVSAPAKPTIIPNGY
jgi:hypothetical protein